MAEVLTDSDWMIQEARDRCSIVSRNSRINGGLETELEENPQVSRAWAIQRVLDQDSLMAKLENFNSYIETILSTGTVGTGDELDKYNTNLLENYRTSRTREFIESPRQHQMYILRQRKLVDQISKYEGGLN